MPDEMYECTRDHSEEVGGGGGNTCTGNEFWFLTTQCRKRSNRKAYLSFSQ